MSGLLGRSEDVFAFSPTSAGSSTSGYFRSPLFFDGSSESISSDEIKAFYLDASAPISCRGTHLRPKIGA